MADSRKLYEALARAAAQKYGVDPEIFVRQIAQESGFNPNAVSPAGARGIAQFMPATAEEFGIDPNDPEQALDAAARYMKMNLERYGGDYSKALAAYNTGAGNVDKYGIETVLSDDWANGETKKYIKNILGDAAGAVGGAAKSVKDAIATFIKNRADEAKNGTGTDPVVASIEAVYKRLGFSDAKAKAAAESVISNGGMIGGTSGGSAKKAAGGLGDLGKLLDSMGLPPSTVEKILPGVIQAGPAGSTAPAQKLLTAGAEPGLLTSGEKGLVPIAGTLRRTAAGAIQDVSGATANRLSEAAKVIADRTARAGRLAGSIVDNPGVNNSRAIPVDGPAPAGLLTAGAPATRGTMGRIGSAIGGAVGAVGSAVKNHPYLTTAGVSGTALAGNYLRGDDEQTADLGEVDPIDKQAGEMVVAAVIEAKRQFTTAEVDELLRKTKDALRKGIDAKTVADGIKGTIGGGGGGDGERKIGKGLLEQLAKKLGVSVSDLDGLDPTNQDDLDFIKTLMPKEKVDRARQTQTITRADGQSYLIDSETGAEIASLGQTGEDSRYVTANDKRTGKSYKINRSDPNDRTELGQFDWATEDPMIARAREDENAAIEQAQWERTFGEGTRRFDVTEGRLNTGQNQNYEINKGNLGVSQGNLDVNRGQLDVSRQNAALEQQKFMAEILRRPSDFLARAYAQRGSTSPMARVSQADLINNLKGSLQQFAQGGATTEGRFLTGEQGAEMIINPTNAPIQVLNNQDTMGAMQGMGKLSGYARGTITNWGSGDAAFAGMRPQDAAEYAYQNPGLDRSKASTFSGGGVAGSYMPTDEQRNAGLAQFGAGLSRPTAGMTYRGAQLDRGGAGYNSRGAYYSQGNNVVYADQLDNVTGWRPEAPAPITQEELVAMGKNLLPPGAKAALYGGAMPSARPVGELTMGRLGQLTQGELEALNTQLGVEYNTELQNEVGLLRQRFGPVVNRSRGRLAVR